MVVVVKNRDETNQFESKVFFQQSTMALRALVKSGLDSKSVDKTSVVTLYRWETYNFLIVISDSLINSISHKGDVFDNLKLIYLNRAVVKELPRVMTIYDVDMPITSARSAIRFHFRKNGFLQDGRWSNFKRDEVS